MRRWSFVVLVSYLGMLFSCQQEQGREANRISQLSFEEVQREVARYYAENQVKEYSRRLAGTRVHWRGKIGILAEDGTVRVALDGSSSPNGEFKVSGETAHRLHQDQTVIFTGTIESIDVLETFPPMPQAFVRFKDVLVE